MDSKDSAATPLRDGPASARERRHGPWSLLAAPRVYNWLQRSLAVADAREQVANRHIRARQGDRVLDVGCGPAEILSFLPSVDYLGVDLNTRYLEAARDRYPGAQFLEMDVRGLPAEWRGTFDLVLAQGLLHHFSDEQALGLLTAARGFLKPTGRLITVDPAFADGQPSIARFLASIDRGRFVRTVDQYRELAGRAFPAVELSLRHDLMRVPYTHVIMECGN